VKKLPLEVPMAPKKAATPEPVENEEAPKEEEVPEEQLKGDFVFPDGSTYKGQYLQKGAQRTIHGEGMLQCGPEVFTGTFERGLYKKGTYTGCNGAVYNGTFKNNQMHGFGEYRWPDSRSYKGIWKDGKMHGRGKFSNFSFGADQTKEGFSVMGEFGSSFAKQQEAKKKFLEEYGEEYRESAVACLKELAEKAGAAGSMEPCSAYLVPQVTDDDELDEAQEAKEARSKVDELISGKCPKPEEVIPAGLQALLAGLTPDAETGECKSKVMVMEKSTEASVIDPKRLKVSGHFGIMANQQLQHVGQCVEFVTIDAESGASIAPKLALVNINRDFDVEKVQWKIVYYEEPEAEA
jgi:hypothetical protein